VTVHRVTVHPALVVAEPDVMPFQTVQQHFHRAASRFEIVDYDTKRWYLWRLCKTKGFGWWRRLSWFRGNRIG